MTKLRFLVIFLVFCSTWAVGSELSGVGGAAWPGSVPVGASMLDFDSSPVFGARFEKDLFFIFGIESNLMIAPGLLGSTNLDGKTAVYYTGNAVFNFPVEKVVPNVVLGIGLMHRPSDERLDVGVAFLTNWGFGVKFRELAGPVGFRVDLRRIGIRDVADEKSTTTEVTGGLLLTW